MPPVPAFCPRCKSIFPGPISVGPGSSIGVTNVLTNCPICGFEEAKISDGVYRARQDAMEIILASDSTHEILETLRTLAERLSSGAIDKTVALEQARELPPKYAALFETFATLGLPALALLIAMISAYLQYEGNKSSSEDAKKILMPSPNRPSPLSKCPAIAMLAKKVTHHPIKKSM
jgi:hypothetical protein